MRWQAIGCRRSSGRQPRRAERRAVALAGVQGRRPDRSRASPALQHQSAPCGASAAKTSWPSRVGRRRPVAADVVCLRKPAIEPAVGRPAGECDQQYHCGHGAGQSDRRTPAAKALRVLTVTPAAGLPSHAAASARVRRLSNRSCQCHELAANRSLTRSTPSPGTLTGSAPFLSVCGVRRRGAAPRCRPAVREKMRREEREREKRREEREREKRREVREREKRKEEKGARSACAHRDSNPSPQLGRLR